MRGEKLAQVREAALQVLAGLDDGEAFNVILYNEGVDPFADRPVRKSRATMRNVAEFLEGMTARGGTNIHDALLEALRQPPAEGTLPIVLFMTDGLPTVGQTSEAAIRELARKGNPHRRRIFTFGVGVDVNTPLLEKVAYESRATTAFILPGEDVEVKVAAVFKRLRGPVLADPTLDVGETEARRRTRELIPGRIPDLFEGNQIVVLGQYAGEEPLEFSLRGNYRGTPRVFKFRLSLDQATTRNGFVPRLWAGRKIGLLVDAIRERGGDPGLAPRATGTSTSPATRELVDEIVRLSTEFGILTEYTAFLARQGTDFSQKDKVLSEAEGLFRDPRDPDPQRALVGQSRFEQPVPEEHRVPEPAEQVLGRDDERGGDRGRPAGLRPGLLQAERPLGGQPDRRRRGRGPAPEGHRVRLRGVPRPGGQAGARGAPGEHRAPRRHPDARRRPTCLGQGARRSTVIASFRSQTVDPCLWRESQ